MKNLKQRADFCFGSNRLSFKHYQDSKVSDCIRLIKSFQGGRIGVDGLRRILEKE